MQYGAPQPSLRCFGSEQLHQHDYSRIACIVPACYRFAKSHGMCLIHASTLRHSPSSNRVETSLSLGSSSPTTSTSSTLSSQDEAASTAMLDLYRQSSPRGSDAPDLHDIRNKSSRRCFISSCHKFARIAGLCTQHNMKLSNQRRKCNVDECRSYARTAGLCIRHGGGKMCSVEGCNTVQQSGGLCRAHGGGSKCKPCKHDGCTHFARVGGLCGQHKHHATTPSLPSLPSDRGT
ncbi:hypothetical protein H310_03868 [Aphanomyces invadans]|uniref:WRKY19-like zinc finger domain-containing protein n=1 Tax=Aphanomyces invadans TaxID=157072 RepID=A0A024UES6_9STRA|nr:hypothetical protein H310_03868 [Aphanomyces invadans]ETW04715.1 hypothetical protein H310_03868 [Aphanomyces invadans]|eukprot:XP_008866153.1 hypothetical protein H310_03868 [Aphanomyces invadans]